MEGSVGTAGPSGAVRRFGAARRARPGGSKEAAPAAAARVGVAAAGGAADTTEVTAEESPPEAAAGHCGGGAIAAGAAASAYCTAGAYCAAATACSVCVCFGARKWRERSSSNSSRSSRSIRKTLGCTSTRNCRSRDILSGTGCCCVSGNRRSGSTSSSTNKRAACSSDSGRICSTAVYDCNSGSRRNFGPLLLGETSIRQERRKQQLLPCLSLFFSLLLLLLVSSTSSPGLDSMLQSPRDSSSKRYSCSKSSTVGTLGKLLRQQSSAKVAAPVAASVRRAVPVLSFAEAAATPAAAAQRGEKRTMRVLGMRFKNLSLRQFTLHYYYAEELLQQLKQRLAEMFEVSPSKVSILQVRPDAERPRDACFASFDIISKPLHDQQGQLREYLKQAGASTLAFSFGGKTVVAEPLVDNPSEAIIDKLPDVESPRHFEWRRPGVERPAVNPLMVLQVRTFIKNGLPRHKRYAELEAAVRGSLSAVLRATYPLLSESDIRVVNYREDKHSRLVSFAVLREKTGSKYIAALTKWLKNACSGKRAVETTMLELQADCTLPVLTTAEGVPVTDEVEILRVVREAEQRSRQHQETDSRQAPASPSLRGEQDDDYDGLLPFAEMDSSAGAAPFNSSTENSSSQDTSSRPPDDSSNNREGSTENFLLGSPCEIDTEAKMSEDETSNEKDAWAGSGVDETAAFWWTHHREKNGARQERPAMVEEQENHTHGGLGPWGKAAVVLVCVGLAALALLGLYCARQFWLAKQETRKKKENSKTSLPCRASHTPARPGFSVF